MIEIPPCLPDHVAGPDVVYSTLPGPVIQFDGACYSNPTLVESITNEDNILIISSGTNLNDCARVECGPTGMYCYISVDLPITAILVFQPLHFPAPIVAMPENRSRCYHQPSLVQQVFENYGTVSGATGKTTYGSYALPVSQTTCGVSYLYTACNGNEQIVVVNESSPTVYYDGQCWTDPQVVINYGTELAVLAGTLVTPVANCQDIMCSGSDATGPVVTYEHQAYGITVPVRFSNLDTGIPWFGVAPAKTDDGESGLTPGTKMLRFDANHPEQVIIPSVSASGRINLFINLSGIKKVLTITRGGSVVATHQLPQSDNNLYLDVLAGDRLALTLASAKTNLKVRGIVSGYAKWKSSPRSFRQYDSATLNYVGSTTIRAVSFTGLEARTPYVFYGTLPAVDESAYPNPDTYLTVQGASGPEYVLVKSQAVGEVIPTGPDDTTAYAGQAVTGPLTFRFYTGRGEAGAHGEMDVWLDAQGQFPPTLAAGRYSLLVRPDTWYRRTAQVGDTSRAALAVALHGAYYGLPGVYTSSAGVVAVVSGPLEPTFESNGTTYALTGTADGLAYTVI